MQSLEDVIISKVYIRRPVFVHQTFHFALLSPQGLRNKVRVPASARVACLYQCTRVQFNLFHSLLLSFSTVRSIVTKNPSSLGLICYTSRKHKVLFENIKSIHHCLSEQQFPTPENVKETSCVQAVGQTISGTVKVDKGNF